MTNKKKRQQLRQQRRLEQKKQQRKASAGNERVYCVDGMHCPACEILIEKKLLDLDNVHSVEASTSKAEVVVEYEGREPTAGQLNKLFKPEGYTFSSSPPGKTNSTSSARSRSIGFSKVAVAVIVSLALIVLLQKAGLSRLVTVNSKSTLPVFLLLGLVAGFSSCAALVGGVVLSMSKQWGELHAADDPLKKRLEPHLLFNTGRLISFAVLGAGLAMIGGTFRVTPTLSAALVIGISIVMVALGLQMLGVRYFQRFKFRMPRSITRYVADESNFKGRYMPFAMGALTFFLPCGFAITAQSFALLSGKPLQGGLIMLFFALGTLPMLLAIGFSSVKFLEKPGLAQTFLKVAGVIVLFFALFNINNQLVVLGAPNLSSLLNPGRASGTAGTASLTSAQAGGKQVLKMEASASGYNPSSLTVKAGIPVRWEIKDTGTSGCTNAVISQDLFSGQIALTPGQTSTKEFTPKKPGRYAFSCWMGMVSGTINVVEAGSKQDLSKGNTADAGNQGRSQSAPVAQPSAGTADGLPAIVDGKQVLQMEASASGYNPNHFKVRVGVPVRFEVRDNGASSCTNSIKAISLFPDVITLKQGETSVEEFTPNKVGRFRFSCWMGMVKGLIDVVDEKNPNQSKFDFDESNVPTGGCCG